MDSLISKISMDRGALNIPISILCWDWGSNPDLSRPQLVWMTCVKESNTNYTFVVELLTVLLSGPNLEPYPCRAG